jgi:hypothetical protein
MYSIEEKLICPEREGLKNKSGQAANLFKLIAAKRGGVCHETPDYQHRFTGGSVTAPESGNGVP